MSLGLVTHTYIYASALYSLPDVKEKFDEALGSTISNMLGDLSARIGSDCDLWPSHLGCHGIGKMNKNGQRLMEFYNYYNLCVTNTFCRTSHTIKCPGDIQDQITGIRWTWSSPDIISLIVLATLEQYHVLTAVLIILWSSSGSNYNWRSSIRPNRKVAPASTSADKNQEFMKWFAKMLQVKQEQSAEDNEVHPQHSFKAAIATYMERKNGRLQSSLKHMSLRWSHTLMQNVQHSSDTKRTQPGKIC